MKHSASMRIASLIPVPRFLISVLLSGILLFPFGNQSSAAPMVGAYTINSAVVTGGTNFQSFNALADSLNSKGISGNVTVTVTPGSGPYTEQVNFNTVAGAGPSAQVTLEGSGEVITAVTDSTNRHVVRLSNVQYFTINNLQVLMAPGSARGFYGFQIYSTGSHITISNCDVSIPGSTSTLFGGYIISGSTTSILTTGIFSNITIDNNHSSGGGYGVSCYGSPGVQLATGIVISNNTLDSSNTNAIYIYNTDGIIVSGNTINFSASNGIQLAGANNINALVEKNKISASNPTNTLTFRGIYVFGNNALSQNKVINNLIYNMYTPEGNVVALSSRDGGEFYFNTVILDDTSATGGNLSLGFEEELTNTASVVKNNIFYIARTSANYGAAIALASNSALTTAITSDHNVFYLENNSYVAVKKGLVSTSAPNNTYTTLGDWQAASTQDSSSFQLNPFFVSSALPQPTNGIINNTGTPIAGVTDDITGTTGNRSTAPDPGAYEFDPAANDAAITAFVPPAFPFCGNNLSVQFLLVNAGSSTINSITINWTVNGVSQAQVTLNALGLASTADTLITLGTAPVTSNTLYNFTATASNPNSVADANPVNDSYTETGWRTGFNGTYTINGLAAPSGTNYQTFQSIFDDLVTYGVCGPVTINVLNGPYTQQVTVRAIPNASGTNSITLNGNAQVLQYDATATTVPGMVTLIIDGASYVTVDNLVVNGLDAASAIGINIINDASHITIRNTAVNIPLTVNSASSGAAITTRGTSSYLNANVGTKVSYITISGCTLTGGGISMVGNFIPNSDRLRNISLLNNTIINPPNEIITTLGVTNITVSGNDISNPGRAATGTMWAFYIWGGTDSLTLEKNKLHDIPGTSGIYCIQIGGGFYPVTGTIRNNLIYNINNSGGYQYAIQDNSTGDVSIYHNTIVLDAQVGGNGTRTAYQWGAVSTSTPRMVKNNIFYINSNSTGKKVLVDVSTASNDSLFICDNNVLYFDSSAAGTLNYGEIGGTSYTAFSGAGSWQAAGKDVHGASINPLFTDPGTGNFRPTEVSINNIGAPVNVHDDILGLTRSTIHPDPGAYEFAFCNPPATPGAITGDTLVCENETGVIYSITPVSGVSLYHWTVPAGATITSGQGTTSITVSFLSTAGDISVTGEDSCDVSAASTISISLANAPGAPTVINGDGDVCANATNVAYTTSTVNGATSYTWAVPTGATIAAGQGTTSVTVDFGTASGIITVKANNSCGASTAIAKNISVHAAPAVTLSLPTDTLCSTAGPLTLSGGSPTGGTYSGPGVSNNIFFAGNAGVGTHTITYSAQDSIGCASSNTDALVVQICPGVANADLIEISVYPNPFTTSTTVSLGTTNKAAFVTLYDAIGKQAAHYQMNDNRILIGRGSLPAGVYTLTVEDASKVLARRKVVIQ